MKADDWFLIGLLVTLFALGQVVGIWGALAIFAAAALFLRVKFG